VRRQKVRRSSTFWIILIVVIVLGVAAVVATVSGGGSSSKSTGTASSLAPAELVSKVTGVSNDVSNKVVAGNANMPQSLDSPALTKDGKPLVVFMGAEYCPFCAAQRWAMVLALSRFGTFTDLRQTTSSSSDVYPSTPTFSFHDVKYSSPYLALETAELQTNKLDPSTGTYTSLDTPTAAQEKLLTTYDKAPYVNVTTPGSIPFIDFGGKYVLSGAMYSPAVLQGKTADQIASALSNPNDPITQGIVGSANSITAVLCKLTGNQPATVCSQPAIQTLMGQIK
jgi:hypothetical protein